MRIGRRVMLALAVAIAIAAALFASHRRYPEDTAPEGAYLRIAQAVDEERVHDMFAYLETDAQWACFTIRDVRAKACARIRASYPKEQSEDLLRAYAPIGDLSDGADVFALFATRLGWVSQLRRDLSAVAKVDVQGERASVVTVRGTRYPFRRRGNGIWGLTLFTAQLMTEADRASRDLAVVEAAAADYERTKGR